MAGRSDKRSSRSGPTRRAFGFGAAAMALVPAAASAAEVEDGADMKPGDFTWHPDRSPNGPVAIVVSIPNQMVFVYRNGIRIGVSTCSTGKAGHDTPTGVFTILQKDRTHHSSLYNEASMPNTERLTWSGVALHAGGLPGYPSSHGCVHLPLAFSSLLYSVTTLGTPVIIAGAHDEPVDVGRDGLVLADIVAEEARTAAAVAEPHGASAAAPEEAVSIIVSSADKRILVLVNGVTAADGPAHFDFPDKPLGSYTFVLNRSDSPTGDLRWHAIGFDRDSAAAADAQGTLFRIHADPKVTATIQSLMKPGDVLVTTDLPLHPDATGKDLVVMNSAIS